MGMFKFVKEGDLNTVQRTPQNDSEKNIATATLERHKSQIEKLQSEIATVSITNMCKSCYKLVIFKSDVATRFAIYSVEA